MRNRALQIFTDALYSRAAFAPLLLRALAPRNSVALTLLCHCDLSPELLRAFTLFVHQASELSTAALCSGTGSMSRIASRFRGSNTLFGNGSFQPQVANTLFENPELAMPRCHFARCQRYLDSEASAVQLDVLLSATALPRQRANLRLHFRNEIVQPAEVDCGLLEAPLGAALAVAIEPHARGFLEKLTTLVRAVRQESIDHLALDHHARISPKTGAPHHVVNVAKAAGRIVEQVVAVPGATEPARDDYFAKWNPEGTIVILEVEGDLGDVYRAPCRGALKDHLFHFGAAERARALLAEDPSHRIGDVRLAASIRPDDRRDTRLEHQLCFIGERFESMKLELRETH